MNNQYNGHLCIVFALEHYNPLNMIRALGENGINPVYVSVKRRYEVATKSKYIFYLCTRNHESQSWLMGVKAYS